MTSTAFLKLFRSGMRHYYRVFWDEIVQKFRERDTESSDCLFVFSSRIQNNILLNKLRPNIYWILLLLTIFTGTSARAAINIKVSASNPSEFSEQPVVVKSYLPKRIKPAHVLNNGGLELGYDVKLGQYYVYKNVTLKPLEEVSYNVEIEDIWVISLEELEKLKAQAEASKTKLGKSEYSNVSSKLGDNITQNLEDIIQRQEGAQIPNVSPVEHIGAYELNGQIVGTIKEDVSSLGYLVGLAAREVEDYDEESMDSAKEGIKIIRVKDQSKECEEGILNTEKEIKTVVHKIIAENPSSLEPQTVPVNYFFPMEVRASDVVDSGELTLGFDFEKDIYYVYNNEVQLEAAEQKSFDIVLINKWIIDKQELISLKIHIESIINSIGDWKRFGFVQELGKKLADQIYDLLSKTPEEEFTNESIESFNEDQKAIKGIKRDLKRMEDILSQAGVVTEATIVEDEKICEEAVKLVESNKEDWLKKEGGGLLEATGLTAQQMKLIAGSIFKGKGMATASTWAIINYIIIFLGLISSVFYFTHIRQRKGGMFDPLTGAFSKRYIMDRLKEEVKIAKGTGGHCSLMVMDMDKFKTINDTYGHSAGDMILKEFVIAIRKAIRATDLLGRFGGDEFVIVLPTAENTKALQVAEEIADSVRNHDIKIEKKKVTVTCSIGVAAFPEDSGTADDLFNKADKALYTVKQRGRDGAALFQA